MKVYKIHEADNSPDINVKLTAVRASRYRMFGSPERIPENEIVVVDLRDGARPDDFDASFSVLDRHPMYEVLLVRRKRQGSVAGPQGSGNEQTSSPARDSEPSGDSE